VFAIYIGFRVLLWSPNYRLLERWRNWRQGKGWQVCPHVQTVLERCVDGTYLTSCRACGQAMVRFTEEDRRKEQAREARWHWCRLTLRWTVLPATREVARFCTFVGSLVVALALMLYLTWGTVAPELKQGLIELGTQLERSK